MPAKKKPELPPKVLASDLKYPVHEKRIPWEQQQSLGLESTSLTFYQTKSGWTLTTLHISNASRRQAAGTTARSYGITCDSKEGIVSVGRGPHVLQEVTVYLTKDNLERLMPYVILWKKGMEAAGTIRDRRSSRIAQGQLHRAAGRDSWRWDS